ncbi:MAG: HAMP domain-containing histidine kinase [Planctomycetes bacterium]|nr:HAMP domain-containing histidine kinase [Planctomycetota bacterium]
MNSLLENRKSLHKQVVDSQMQFEALDARLRELQPLANLGMAWAMTAHELNNLLTPIVSYAQLALQNPDDAELSAKALKKAERLSTQAGKMLEKVMVLANPGTTQTERCNVTALLDDVFGCIGRDFTKDKIKLIVDVDKELSITADAGAIRQVLMNLLLNARHAMCERGGTLCISAGEEVGFTRIEVSDTGCGVDPDKLHHIFTPFYTDGKKNGNGLGLAFCQKVIESHGGCISVDSQLDQGTHFKILLPKSDL